MAELNDKLKELLETQGVDGDFNIDVVAEQLGLDEDQKKLLAAACSDIDEIDKKASELEESKKEGYSIKEWVVNNLWEFLGNAKDEDKSKVIEAVGNSLETEIENLGNKLPVGEKSTANEEQNKKEEA